MTTETITVSDRAFKRIAEILQGEPVARMMRVSVEGGGCSGFQYKFDLVPGAEADDIVIEKSGVSVLVDTVSLPFMAGSELDFVDDLMGRAFKVKNPNAVASCGCGVSFTL